MVQKMSTSLSIPVGLVNGLLKKFATKERKNTYTRDQLHQDKLKMYIFVLALSLHSYNMRIGGVCEALSLPSEKAANFFKEIGCVVTAAPAKEKQQGHSVELRVPLTFPRIKRLKKK